MRRRRAIWPGPAPTLGSDAHASNPVPPAATDDRRAAYRWGLSAETRAAWWLRFKGYRVLERRFKVPVGEIDLIARKGRTLVFVEVKARDTEAAAIEAVTPKARRRILAAADVWVARRPAYHDHDRRFDLVLVLPGRLPVHRLDAFRVGD